MNAKNSTNVSPNKRNQSLYEIPHDYDRTPKDLLPLDNYLLNKDVDSLVKTLFSSEGTDWDKWAIDNTFDAQSYFSAPYCDEARGLGYTSDHF